MIITTSHTNNYDNDNYNKTTTNNIQIGLSLSHPPNIIHISMQILKNPKLSKSIWLLRIKCRFTIKKNRFKSKNQHKNPNLQYRNKKEILNIITCVIKGFPTSRRVVSKASRLPLPNEVECHH